MIQETPGATPDTSQRWSVLIAAYSAWMFAGLEISLFILIHRQMMTELLGPDGNEKLIAQWLAWFQAAFLFGAAAGGWLFGWMGDRFGRTFSMGCSVVCYSGFTLVAWFVDDPPVMWCVRFLACLGVGGAWPNSVALVAEACPTTSRPMLAGLLGTAANFGFVILGIIGYFARITNEDWRWVLLVGSAPLLIGVWTLLAVPESAAWKKLRQSAAADSRRSAPIAEVLRPPILYRTLLGISLGAVPVVGTAANANWVVPWTDQVMSREAAQNENPAGSQSTSPYNRNSQAADSQGIAKTPPKTTRKPDPRQKAKTQILRSTGAIFGSLLGGAISSFLGRRITYFLISLATFATSTWLFTQLNPLHPQFDLFVFVLGFFGVTYFGWLPLFLPELFPTHVRSTGSGISFNTGRVLAAFVVLFAGFRMSSFQGDYAQVGLWSGMIYVVGMIIIWFAPRHPDKNEITS
jgi:MFS transporter, SHS family, sialic acid transporter